MVVVGAGLIGLCTAWQLHRQGARVTTIDRGAAGGGCSLANTGWVVPALSAPVAAPGSIRQGVQMLLARDNPFRIHPRPSPALMRWLAAFVRSAQPARFGAGAAAILALNARTLEHYDELAASGVEFEMHKGGIIFLALDRGPLLGAQERFRQIGYQGELELLDAEAVRHREPSVSAAVAGGLHIKPERYVRPETLCRGLVDALRSADAEVLEHAPVTRIERSGDVWRVRTAGRELEADRVVIAAGIWSGDLTRSLGLSLPMQAGKGYSVTARGAGTPPAHALFFVEAMVGAAPYDSGVRLAGMLEITGIDARVDPRRVRLVYDAARTYLDGWDPRDAELEWAGLRPLPPDGLPIIGPVPGQDGLFLATGHGMVGLTLAPATAALVAPMVLEGTVAPELEPFSVQRFGRGFRHAPQR